MGTIQLVSASFSIRAVAERTGLSAHTIRAWERRYGVLEPTRTGTNRRAYTEEDVDRLIRLKHAVASGHSIGMVAGLSADELKRLDRRAPAPPSRTDTYLDSCLSAIRELDGIALDLVLSRAAAVLGLDRFLDELIIPLMDSIDQGWEDGFLGISQEHLASSYIRTHLEKLRLSLTPSPGSPRLLVTTPAGQIHEIGALLAAIRATQIGWSVTYLGPNTPASEIVRAARQTGASAIGLSVVYPQGDPKVEDDLRALRQELGNAVEIVVGGRARESYGDVLAEIGAKSALEPVRSKAGR